MDNVLPISWSDIDGPKLSAINLELTAKCNEKCSFCPNPLPDFRAKGDIALNLIEKMTEELSQDISIAVCGIGEPSLHPRFEEAIQILNGHFRRISVVTNGCLFRNEKLSNSVLLKNVNKINVSIDYVDPKQYLAVKQAKLDKILSYLDGYINIANDSEYSPMLQINFLYDSIKGADEYIKAYEYFSKKIKKDNWCIYIRKIKNWAEQVSIKEESDEELLDHLFKDYIGANFVVENWNRYLRNTNWISDQEKPNTCRHIYKYYMLLWNGDVVPCCIDAKGTMPVGNANAKGFNFNDIFFSAEYVELRKQIDQRNFKLYPLCGRCNDFYKHP
ncbi:MAG: radical SAM protein [Sulfuricellaceae bacterium]